MPDTIANGWRFHDKAVWCRLGNDTFIRCDRDVSSPNRASRGGCQTVGAVAQANKVQHTRRMRWVDPRAGGQLLRSGPKGKFFNEQEARDYAMALARAGVSVVDLAQAVLPCV